MQTSITEPLPPLPIFASEAYFELFEPKRVVISPLELCQLARFDDLFEED